MKTETRQEFEKDELADRLWTISAKIRGLSDLFSLAQGDPPFSDTGLKGLSYMLSDLATECENLLKNIDSYGQK